ncbi:uncharacterized protein LOC111438100 [Cucurbita moschata]|uniref:Uncharacterized protein LOC111438100 n=1 Tax=Cucurbita moschata TaxID=3662 RepID=A0A6J1EUP3_CUCMO|nr:uncharacterized protein LOC111438100 [Cucurbita moschata]
MAMQLANAVATQPANAAAPQSVDAVAIQPMNNPHPNRGASWLKDFKRYNPRPFVSSKEDSTAAQMWIANMETTFESMRCPDEHKVACATYVLQKDAEVWWSDNKQSINLGGGITTWETFKKAFLKYYYPKETCIKKQQEFNHLTQGDRMVDQYDQDFMRLRRFAPSLADTEEKQTEKFVLGLNPKTRRMLEAFNPKTYEEALRTAKALEEPPEEKKTEPTVVTGRKCPVEVDTTKFQPPS